MSHFLNNNDEKAKEVFNTHLKDTSKLMFQKIIQDSREKQDDATVERLIKVLQEAKVSEGALGNAYSCLIDITTTKGDAKICVEVINKCVKDVSFENVNRTALLRAKECIEKAGLKFPHNIPERKTKNQESSSSSSSSSSDDEVKQKKE